MPSDLSDHHTIQSVVGCDETQLDEARQEIHRIRDNAEKVRIRLERHLERESSEPAFRKAVPAAPFATGAYGGDPR